MLIFLFGPDDYRRTQKKKDFVAEFLKKRSALGLAYFDLEDREAVGRFEDFIANQSMFEAAKLAVLENAFEVDAKILAKLIAPFRENKTMSVLIAEREKPVKALAFLRESPSVFQEFEELQGPAWLAFITKEARALGLTLDPAAARFLGVVYQGRSWALVTELQKLASFKSAITKNDLDAFDLEAAPNYWMLLNALTGADGRARLFALESMLALNDPPAKIFNLLASRSREKIPRMAELDFAVKSGKLEYEEAILDAVLGNDSNGAGR